MLTLQDSSTELEWKFKGRATACLFSLKLSVYELWNLEFKNFSFKILS